MMHNNSQSSQKGFSFIELGAIIIIIAIFVVIAIPTMKEYRLRQTYDGIVKTAHHYKARVEACFSKTQDLKRCNAGKQNIPAPSHATKTNPHIQSLDVRNGQISVSVKPHKGIKSEDNYILTPHNDKGLIKWVATGKAVEKGYAN